MHAKLQVLLTRPDLHLSPEAEELVEPKIGQQMQTTVEEGKQTDEPAEADDPIPSRDAARRSY